MDEKITFYLEEIKQIKNQEFIPPVTCEIDISNKCSLDCKFCMCSKYIKNSRVDMTMENYLRLIYDLKRIGTRSITFTGGGEPLENPLFNKFIDIAFDLQFEVGLITNGMFLDKVQKLSKFKFIRVSLDASDSETYKIVKGVDCFDKVVENIKNALKQNKTVGISYIVGPDNNTRLVDAQTLADTLGVIFIQFKPAYINNEAFKFKMPKQEETTMKTYRYKTGERLPCQIAHLVGIVTADGGVYYCSHHRGEPQFYIGSISQESFESLWTKRLHYKNFAIKQCPPCRYANYARYLKELTSKGELFFDHRHFL